MNRQPAVAGQFYEATDTALRSRIASYVEDIGDKVEAKAIVSPHAGYACSGPVAGKVYSRIVNYDTYLILGPNHTGMGAPLSVFSEGSWDMPMGEARIDADLCGAILARSDMASKDELAHLMEHSLEVQVPFIQYFSPEALIAPICVGFDDYELARQFGVGIASAVSATKKRVLIVASTDMSHQIPHKLALERDRPAIDKMLELDAEGLYHVVRRNNITMCGVMPTVIALVAALELGATSAKLVSYMTSGDTCSNRSRVVGYAGVIID